MRPFSAFCCFAAIATAGTFTRELDELERRAADNGVASRCADERASYVRVNGREHGAYAFDGRCDGDATFRFRRNTTLYLLYTCANCEFARWTRRRLLRIVELVPAAYHRSFAASAAEPFASYGRGLRLRRAVANTERFVDALLRFQNAYADANDSSADAQLTAALFKLNLAAGDGAVFGAGRDGNAAATRVLLEALNSIQRFAHLNCETSTDYGHRQFYGISARADDDDDDDDDRDDREMDAFLGAIETLVSNEKPDGHCGVSRMLLIDVMTEIGDGRFRWVIRGRDVRPSTVVERVLSTDDAANVFWYQKHVIAALAKLSLRQLRSPSSHDSLRSAAAAVVEQLVSLTGLFGNTAVGDPRQRPDSNRWPEEEHLAREIDERSWPEVRYVADVADFPVRANTFAGDFACFARLYKHLSREFGERNGSFADRTEIFEREILAAEFSKTSGTSAAAMSALGEISAGNGASPSPRDTNECRLFTNLYHYFFKFATDLNRARGDENKETGTADRFDYYLRIRTILATVFKKLKELSPATTGSPNGLKTILNIMARIELRDGVLFTERNHDELKRTIYVSMTELNAYGIRHCNPPNHNFLFFNNIDFGVIPQLRNVDELIDGPVDAMRIIKNVEPRATGHDRDWYETVFTPITRISNRIKEFHTYDEIIKQNWRGEKVTLVYLYECLERTTLSTRNALALLEYSLKFSLAVLFYEVDRNVLTDRDRSGIAETNVSTDRRELPEKYKDIESQISDYVLRHDDPDAKEDARQKILDGLNDIGVFITFPQSETSISSDTNTAVSSETVDNRVRTGYDRYVQVRQGTVVTDIRVLLKDLKEAIFNLNHFDVE